MQKRRLLAGDCAPCVRPDGGSRGSRLWFFCELLRRKVPQWQVDSSFRSAQIFCSCPMNYSHAIYKGKEADELL